GHTALVGENNRIYQSTGITDSGSIDFGIIFDAIMFRGYDETNSLGLSVQATNNTWMTPFRNESHPEYPYYGRFYRDEIIATRLKFLDVATKDDEIDIALDY